MQDLPENLIERIALAARPADRPAMRRSSRAIRDGMRHIPPDQTEVLHAVLKQMAVNRRVCMELSFKPVFDFSWQPGERTLRVFPQPNGKFTVKYRWGSRKDKDITLGALLELLQQPDHTVFEASIYRIRPTSPNFRPVNYIRTTTVGRCIFRRTFKA